MAAGSNVHRLLELLSFVLMTLALCAACGDPEAPPVPDAGPAQPASCNPLSADHCMLPWPSTFYLKKDTTTQTRYRLAYSKQVMPLNKDGVQVDTARFNQPDGFSFGSQMLVHFKQGISPKGLPGQDALATSLGAKSLIWLLEYSTGARVPLLSSSWRPSSSPTGRWSTPARGRAIQSESQVIYVHGWTRTRR